MNANHTVISTTELTKSYGMGDASVVALDHVSMEVQEGELVASWDRPVPARAP